MARPVKEQSEQLHTLMSLCVEVWSTDDHEIYLPPQAVVEKIKKIYKRDVTKVTVIEHYRKIGIEYEPTVGIWIKRKE